MNISVVFDWKFVVALGASAIGIVLAVRMDSDAVERVSVHLADTYKECAVAGNGSR